MDSANLRNFQAEFRRLNVFGDDITGNRDVVVLSSTVPRHLMAYCENKERMEELIGLYYQSNTFFHGIDCMQKFEPTSKSKVKALRSPNEPGFDPKAFTDLNESGLYHLRKLWVNLPLEDIYHHHSFVKSHQAHDQKAWVRRTLASDIPLASNITDLTIDISHCLTYRTDEDRGGSMIWQGFKYALPFCINGLKNLKKLTLIMDCRRRSLIRWMNAALALTGFHLKTVNLALTNSKDQFLWRWQREDGKPLIWKHVADLRGLTYVMVTSPHREIIDYWDGEGFEEHEKETKVSSLESPKKQIGAPLRISSTDSQTLTQADRSSIYTLDPRDSVTDSRDTVTIDQDTVADSQGTVADSQQTAVDSQQTAVDSQVTVTM